MYMYIKKMSKNTTDIYIIDSSHASPSLLCVAQHLALLAYRSSTLPPNDFSVCLSSFLSKFGKDYGLDSVHSAGVQCPRCAFGHDRLSKKVLYGQLNSHSSSVLFTVVP